MAPGRSISPPGVDPQMGPYRGRCRSRASLDGAGRDGQSSSRRNVIKLFTAVSYDFS